MAENYMARKDGLWTVVCLSPDVCKTPMGPIIPPVPYQVTANLGNAVQEVKKVKANGCPVVVLDQSFIPTTQGDEPGVAKGIKSGTVGDKCEPMEHSKTVRVGGKPILRHGDKFWMNEKNTIGVIVGQPPSSNIVVGEISSALVAETGEEKSLWDSVKEYFTTKQEKLPDSKGYGSYLAMGALRNGNTESYEKIAEMAGPEAVKGFNEVINNKVVVEATILAGAVAFGTYGARKSGPRIYEGASVSSRNSYPPRPVAVGGGGKVKLNTDGNGKAPTSKHGEPTVSDEKEGNFGGTCGVKGEPVDVATGDFLQNLQVIDLPGTLSLTLNRLYRSRVSAQGVFGSKWADSWSQSLLLDDKKIHFTTDEGSVLSYFSSAKNDKVEGINLHHTHLRLHGSRSGTLFIFNVKTQQTLCFEAQPGLYRRLSSLRDRAGNHIDFIYQDNRLATLIHSDGYRVELAWRNAQLVTVTRVDAQQRQWLAKCSYTEDGLLAECETFQFTHLYHEYDARGLMTRWCDTDKTDVRCRYDAKGRIIATQAEGGYYRDRFIYDDVNRVTTYLDSEGGRTLCEYNVFGLVTRETDPLDRVTLTRWDRGNKISQTDPLGRETRFRYNPSGQITHVQCPGGDVTQYRYDEHGQVIKLIQPEGGEWLFDRNAQGKILSQTDPQGRCQQFEYSTHGQLTRDISAEGAVRRYVWNEYHQLSQMMTPDEATTLFSQDSLGRLKSMTDPLGQTTRYMHSEQHAGHNGSLTAVHLPDGVIQRTSYDGEKRQATVTDGEGKTTGYAYGAFDLLHTLTRPDGQPLHFGYDSLTRLNQVTNAAGEVWRYERDAAGQVVRETDFNGRITEYSYDAAGRRVQARHADHRVVRWLWSVRDELLCEDIWQEEVTQYTLVATTAYTYDAQGRMTRAQNDDALVEFEYNGTGHRVCERINGREVIHGWDEQAQRAISRRAGAQMLTFDYDISGRLKAFQAGEFAPLRMKYDRLGRENQRHSTAGFTQAQGYSPTGMLLEQKAGREGAINRSWAYDAAYNVRRIDDARWGSSHYHYNSNDQIVHADQTGAQPLLELFSYDGNLNLTEQGSRGRYDDVPVERVTQIQQAGRVIRCGNGEYRYDSAGRLAEKRTEQPGYRPQVWRYQWDSHSQIRGLITPDGTHWHYAYDAFGRRISKRREGTSSHKPTGYDYLWSGDQLIEETPVFANGTPAYDESIHWLYEPGAFTPIARSAKGKLHYVVSDHIGTPRELVTEEGDVAWASRLSTWGKASRYRRAANDDESCNLRFAGQYFDEESGLHYNRHRYYDNETGQYLSSDPIGLAGGLNPYGYVHNPLGWVDPLGLACCPPKYGSRNEAFRAAKRDAGIPMGQRPIKVNKVQLTDRDGHVIKDSNFNVLESREYHYTRPDGSKIVIQEHSAGHTYGPPGTPGNQGPHFNTRPFDSKTGNGSRNGSVPGTFDHYEFPRG